jgi:cytochrome c-type biogenesis protein CcmH/NrfG
MTRRAHKILTNHEKTVRAGVRLLEDGEYARAIVALTLASKLDNGDPACRIHLAQARMAQGHYPEAGQALRRALQLQPKLIYLTLGLDRHYPNDSTFGEHIDALSESAARSKDADVHLLLGFMEFQRGEFDPANVAFSEANRLRPSDRIAKRFLEVVKPSGR